MPEPISTGAAILGAAGVGALASRSAAGTQASAADRAGQLQKEVADQQVALQREQFNRQIELQAPWRQAGERALGQLETASQYTPFGMAQFQQDPGYAFRLGEGQKALDRQAAARGGLISGGALKAAQRYGQEMGSQEFGRAYERFRETQGLRRNALAGVVGFAPTAAGSMAAGGQSYAAGAGPQMYQQGMNTGNALLAGQQARSSAYGQVGNVLGRYLGGGSGQSGFGAQGFGAGLNPASGEYMGSLEF